MAAPSCIGLARVEEAPALSELCVRSRLRAATTRRHLILYLIGGRKDRWPDRQTKRIGGS